MPDLQSDLATCPVCGAKAPRAGNGRLQSHGEPEFPYYVCTQQPPVKEAEHAV